MIGIGNIASGLSDLYGGAKSLIKNSSEIVGGSIRETLETVDNYARRQQPFPGYRSSAGKIDELEKLLSQPVTIQRN